MEGISVLNQMYLILTGIMSSLSILGACYTITTFALIPKLRRRGRLLIIYLSIADGAIAVGNVLGLIWIGEKNALKGSPFCTIQAALSNLASMSSFLWNVCIAVHLYLVLVHNKTQMAENLRSYFHVICWLFPIVIVSLTLGFGQLGEDKLTKNPSWCWIRDGDKQILWQLLCSKAWEVIAYIVICVLYSLIVHKLRKQRKALTQSLQNMDNPDHRLSAFTMIHEANRKLMCVPVVFFLLRVWGTSRFLINTIDSGRNLGTATQWLAPIQGLGDSGQGFANCVLYCFLPGSVRNVLWGKCRCLNLQNVGPIHTSSAVALPDPSLPNNPGES